MNGCTREVVCVVVYCNDCSVMSTRIVVPIIVPSIATMSMSIGSTFFSCTLSISAK